MGLEETYSENALNVYKRLYLKKDKNDVVIETIKQCHKRICDQLRLTKDHIEALDNQNIRLNTPCMANAGRNDNEPYFACYILDLDDSMESIIESWTIAPYIYKAGGGCGFPFSNLREKGAPVSSGGYASGPLSYMKVINVESDTVKSGGSCLAPFQKVYTTDGCFAVEDLAEIEGEFNTIVFDRKINKKIAKKAIAFKSGRKTVYKLTTSEDVYYLTADHPVILADKRKCLLKDLKQGNRLKAFNCSTRNGRLIIDKPRNENPLGEQRLFLHRMIAKDILKWEIKGYHIHHKNGDMLDNTESNLEQKTPSDHMSYHCAELIEKGRHPFKNKTFPRKGKMNPMHHSSDFWKDKERVQLYKEKQGEHLLNRGQETILDMQDKAARKRMLNNGYYLLNKGYNIDTVDEYKEALRLEGKSSENKKTLLNRIEKRFDSYDLFLKEINDNNHRVISIEKIGMMDVYDVEIQCENADEKRNEYLRNFPIIGENFEEGDIEGKGIFVSNSRRAANISSFWYKHPDIIDYILAKKNTNNLEAFNTSVLIDNQFFVDLSNSDSFLLQSPSKHTVNNRAIEADDLWNTITESAWECADPGLIFYDRVNEDNPFPSNGNIICSNPCITGDTEICTNEGYKQIKDLVGKEVYVLSQENNKLIYKKMFDIRKTRDKAQTIKIHLKGGNNNKTKTILKVTPDHHLYLKDNTKIKAKDLKKGMRLASCYYTKANQTGRIGVRNSHKDYVLHSHLIGQIKYDRRPNYPEEHCHHKDNDRLNDSIENIEYLSSYIHNSSHKFGESNPMFGKPPHPNFIDVKGEKNPRYRHDIQNKDIQKLWNKGSSINKIASKYNCTHSLIRGRLGLKQNAKHLAVDNNNHIVTKITKGKIESVYNGTVEDTHCYFIHDGKNGGILSANCSEVVGLPWTVCALGHINLYNMLKTENNTFIDFNKLRENVYLVSDFLNSIINTSKYPHSNFYERMIKDRPIGIGIMGFADVCYELEIPYNSEQARLLLSNIMNNISKWAFEYAIDKADDFGRVTIPEADKEHFRQYLVKFGVDVRESYEAINDGIANSTVTCIAPTGSTAISADCSYSFEPHFALAYQKNISDTNEIWNFINPIFKRKCHERGIDLDNNLINKIKQNKGSIKGLNEFSREMQEIFVTAHDIHWYDRLLMQSEVQKRVTMSISSTVNLPNSATQEEVKEIYYAAWKLGLKGITVYRDGSKDSQPIDFGNKDTEEPIAISSTVELKAKLERPGVLQGETTKVKTGSGELYLTVNEHEGKPFEVFATISKSGRSMSAKAEAIGRMVSLALRSGVAVNEIVTQLEGIGGDYQVFQNGGLIKSIPDAIAKALKKYVHNDDEWKGYDEATPIKDTEDFKKQIADICPKCGQLAFVKDGACRGGHCNLCGFSNCE